MLNLPSSTSEIRNLFEVSHLAEIASPANRAKLPTFRMAATSARQHMGADQTIKAVHSICLCADGSLRLIRFGPKGGVKRVWNFGML
jgi:hypothetical protein